METEMPTSDIKVNDSFRNPAELIDATMNCAEPNNATMNHAESNDDTLNGTESNDATASAAEPIDATMNPAERNTSSTETLDFDWQSSKTCAMQRLEFMLNNKFFSDVHFIVGCEPNVKTFYGHKAILASSSKVFEVMLRENEAFKSNEIRLSDDDPAAFFEFLRYLYTDKLCVTIKTAVPVLHYARIHNIVTLQDKCYKFIAKNLKPSNAFVLLNQAAKFKEEQLLKTCFEHIDANTLEAILSDSFCDVDVEVLCSILQRDTLNVGELELLEAVVRWSEVESKRKNAPQQSVLERPLTFIRFPLMTVEDFAAKVAHPRLLPNKVIIFLFMYFNGYRERPLSHCSTPRTGPVNQLVVYDTKKFNRVKNETPQETSKKVIKQGTRRTRHSSCEDFTVKRFKETATKWLYLGGSDEIAFMSDHNLKLKGIGVYASKKTQVNVAVTCAETKNVLYQTPTLICDSSAGMCTVLFKHPVIVTALTPYIIKVWIEGPPSLYGIGGKRENVVTLTSGKTVAIWFTKVEDKSRIFRSHVEMGQIPELFF